MTKKFQQGIQTLMPMILGFLVRSDLEYKTVQNITEAPALKSLLSQTQLLRVIEGLAQSYDLSATTRDFILFHELSLALAGVPNVIILPLLEACNDPIFQSHKSQIVDKKQKT